ncbi:MAG: DNA primase [Candidatus Ancillula sp.]|jgi:DNA primase|nr:DNA primase [Candidatus Ancillula sp.]
MRFAPKTEIERVRNACQISDIVGIYVQLQNAGVGAKKGLCPFHDEKTPSFTVRDSVGSYHCFGCSESGDVFSFVQKVNGLEFYEALDFVASRCGTSVIYEDNNNAAPREDKDRVKRSRIIEANTLAAKFFQDNLNSPEALPARELLKKRNFTAEQCASFGCGYAPKGRDTLARYLGEKGFTRPELEAAGLISNTSSGIFDRFQGRAIWPIKDIAGSVLGFGARKLFDDDFFDAKYLNTAETSVYHKSKVLYGLDLARKAISLKHQIVLVEGYTDVMAMHLAGVDIAVATCGTAFGEDHVKIVRRIMNDTDPSSMILGVNQHQRGKVIFTFDGDSAGLKAATKSFSHDQSFMAQTYVAIVPDGLDPCDLRVQQGDLALRDLVESAKPSFEFMLETTLQNFDLKNAAGRVEAIRSCVPIVGTIRDIALREEYVLFLSKFTGVSIESVQRELRAWQHQNTDLQKRSLNTTSSIPTLGTTNNRKSVDPNVEVEMNYIALLLQYPGFLDSELLFQIGEEHFSNKFFSTVYNKVIELGGLDVGAVLSGPEWISSINEGLSDSYKKGVHKLSAQNLPISNEDQIGTYFTELTTRLQRKYNKSEITRLKAELSTLNPNNPEDKPKYTDMFNKIVELSRNSTE